MHGRGASLRRVAHHLPWLALLGLAAAWTARLGDRLLDDFYITFTYARNLARGDGFVFNLGERVFGLTEPGLGLLLAAAQRLTTVPVHRLGLPIGALALLALVAVLARAEARRTGAGAGALAGGAIALASSFLWVNAAAAWPLVLLALALAADRLERRPVVAGLLAGAAVWLRPDALLGAGLLGLLAWIETRRFPGRFTICTLAVVVLGLACAGLYFGHPLPNTLDAKLAAGAADDAAAAGIAGFWPRAVPLFHRHLGPAWPLLVGLGTAGAGLAFHRSSLATRTLLAFGLALAVAYPLLGVPFYSWYAAPPLFALCLGLALGLRRAFERLRTRTSARVVAVTVALLALVPLASLAWASSRFYRAFEGYAHLESYRRAAEWLRANTPPGTRVTYFEIGVLGYFSERPIRDLMGLVSPDALPYLSRADYRGAFLADPTEIVLEHPRGRFGSMVSKKWFREAYEPVARFDDTGNPNGGGLTVWRRRAGKPPPEAELQRPRPTP